VTYSPPGADTRAEPAADGRAADPYHNPSYPKRTHFNEAAELHDAVRRCDERLESVYQTLFTLADGARKPDVVRLYHQLQGARDQIAETARRMPLEAGELYREDKERFDQATAAFERMWGRWEQAGP
jgi:hypothetical protein